MQAVVLDPEVVFVANLMKADAPALLASFQCDVTLQTEVDSSQIMRANLRELKVQACPFIRNKDDKTITTVRFRFTYCVHLYSLSVTTSLIVFTGTETLLSRDGNQKPRQPTTEWVNHSGGSHCQGTSILIIRTCLKVRLRD